MKLTHLEISVLKRLLYRRNHKSFLTNRPINFVGHSWDSQSSEQSVVPEIQLNDEESAHGSVELNNTSKGCDRETI